MLLHSEDLTVVYKQQQCLALMVFLKQIKQEASEHFEKLDYLDQ